MSSLTVPFPGQTSRGWRLTVTGAARRALALAGLAGLLGAALLLGTLSAAGPSALSGLTTVADPAWLAGPFQGLWPLSLPAAAVTSLLSWCLPLMFACYLLVLCGARQLPATVMFGALAAAWTALALAPPFQGTDLFNYVEYARMGMLEHLNPYAVTSASANHGGLVFALSNWHHLLSPYGPLFTLATYALAPLTPAATYWTAKLMTLATGLAVLGGVGMFAHRRGRSPAPALALVGANPLLLVWGIGGEHNDFFAVAPLLAGVWLLLCSPRARGDDEAPVLWTPGVWRGRLAALAGGVCLSASAGFKASVAVCVPALLAGATRRGWALAGAALGGGLVAAVVLVVFGGYLPNLAQQAQVVGFQSVPNVTGGMLGLGGDTAWLQSVFTGAVALVCALGVCWVAVRREHALAAATVSAMMLVAGLAWSQPWYALWFMVPAALSDSRLIRACAVILCAVMLALFLPQTQAWLGQLVVHGNPALGALHHRQTVHLLR